MDVEGKSCLYTNWCSLVDKQAWFEVDPKLHNGINLRPCFSVNWSRKEYTHLSLALAVACIHTFQCFPVISCFLYRLIHSVSPMRLLCAQNEFECARGEVIRNIQPNLDLISSCPPLLSTSYLLHYSIVINGSLGQWPVIYWIDVVFQTGSKLESITVCYSITWHFVQEISSATICDRKERKELG